MQLMPNSATVVRRYADDQLVTLANLVVEMALQPIVEIGSGYVYGYESLMRGHQKLGFATPIDLLDHADTVQQLLPLEQLLIKRAVSKFRTVPDRNSRLLFINFDTRLISQHEVILDRLMQLIQHADVPATDVCIELSERFDNTQQAGFSAFTQQIAARGLKLAIDDFGIGHGELRLLNDLSIDFVKIDRYFISGIDRVPRKRHLVHHLVKMAHVLGIRVIAEGVETEQELATCRDLGCDLVQGWLLAHPTTHVDQLMTDYSHINSFGGERRQSIIGDELLIRREIELQPTVRETDSIEVAFKLFRQHPMSSYFPVVDTHGMPLGIIHEQQLKYYIYQPFGRDLLRNKSFEHRIGSFLTRTPFASLSSDAELLLDVFSQASGSHCLILTENLRYAGVLSAASLLRIINEKQLKSAQDQNPLTALPGNRSISAFVQDVILDSECDRYLCYCDFDFFKPFNDRYGFQQGDQAILLFATLMRRTFMGEDIFLGHVGGDDFFIGIIQRSRSEVEAQLLEMLAEFNRQVSFLYSAEDCQAGSIEGIDRSGILRQYPLMRCSVAVLELSKGVMAMDARAVGGAIAGLKSQSKASSNGLVFGQL